MEYIIEINGLSKTFGKLPILNGLDFKIPQGKVVGLLGPNGIGKTTLIKILMGFFPYPCGEIRFQGKPFQNSDRKNIAYLCDESFLTFRTIHEMQSFHEHFFENFNTERFQRLLNEMQISDTKNIASLSKGTQERLEVAAVLARNVDFYILDEPIGGVDPAGRQVILDAMVERINAGASMLVVTHTLQDLDSIFDEVAFMKDGRISLQGDADTLRMEHQCTLSELFIKLYR